MNIDVRMIDGKGTSIPGQPYTRKWLLLEVNGRMVARSWHTFGLARAEEFAAELVAHLALHATLHLCCSACPLSHFKIS